MERKCLSKNHTRQGVNGGGTRRGGSVMNGSVQELRVDYRGGGDLEILNFSNKKRLRQRMGDGRGRFRKSSIIHS